MPYQNLDITIPPATLATIQSQLNDIKAQLPFLINLTPKERQTRGALVRQKSSFAINAFEIATDQVALVPPNIDMAGWERDLTALQQLTLIEQQLSQLHEGIDDTILALKSETAVSSSLFYNTLKLFSKTNTPGIDVMISKLKAALGNNAGRKKKVGGVAG